MHANIADIIVSQIHTRHTGIILHTRGDWWEEGAQHTRSGTCSPCPIATAPSSPRLLPTKLRLVRQGLTVVKTAKQQHAHYEHPCAPASRAAPTFHSMPQTLSALGTDKITTNIDGMYTGIGLHCLRLTGKEVSKPAGKRLVNSDTLTIATPPLSPRLRACKCTSVKMYSVSKFG